MLVQKTSAVRAFTEDMMLAVIEKRWSGLMEMQLKQDKMLQALFSESDLVLSEAEQDDLLEVQRLNQEILIAAETAKSDVAKELRTMRQGKAKANAYQTL